METQEIQTDDYLIEPGDTLSELADYFNTDIATLKQLNAEQIKDINLIFADQSLKIPSHSTASQAELKNKRYNPSKADPEQSLAQKFTQVDQCLGEFTQIPVCHSKKEALKKPSCAPGANFIDLLYLPEHPLNQKPLYQLLTEETQQQIIQEDKVCRQAVSQPDKQERLAALNQLGVLEPFKTVGHEFFLEKKDPQLVKNYRTALLLRTALKIKIQNPSDLGVLNQNYPELNINNALKLKKQIKDQPERADGLAKMPIYMVPLVQLNSFSQGVGVDLPTYTSMSLEDRKAHFKKRLYTQMRALQRTQLDQLNTAIEKLEQTAIQEASQLQVRKGDYHFRWNEKGQYYTDTNQLEIVKAMDQLIAAREKLGIDHLLNLNQIDPSASLFDIEKAHKLYQHWQTVGDPVLSLLAEYNLPIDYSYDGYLLWRSSIDFYKIVYQKSKNKDLPDYKFVDQLVQLPKAFEVVQPGEFSAFYQSLYRLNLSGVIIKEQALSEQDLFAGKQAVQTLIEQKLIDQPIDHLNQSLSQLNPPIEQLGYYSAYLLACQLAKEIAQRISQFTSLFEKNTHYAEYVRQVVIHVEKASNRCQELKDKAQHYAQSFQPIHNPSSAKDPEIWSQNDLEACFKNQSRIDELNDSAILRHYHNANKACQPEANFIPQLVWQETSYQPIDRKNLIYPDPGANRVAIAEGSLMSQPGKIFYLRTNIAALSNDNRPKGSYSQPQPEEIYPANEIAKIIGQALGLGDNPSDANPAPSPGSISPNNPRENFKKNFNRVFKIPLASFEKVIDFDKLSSSQLQKWAGHNHFLGKDSSWQIQSEAQMMRFVFLAEAVGSKKNNQGLYYKASTKASLDIASSKIDMKITYPKQSTDWHMSYVDYDYLKKKQAEPHKRHPMPQANIGRFQWEINGAIFGMLAASVELASSVEIGMTHNQRVGLAGRTHQQMQQADYKASNMQTLIGQTRKIGASLDLQTEMFAGLEVGGAFDCKLNWAPPPKDKKQPPSPFVNLFGTGVKVSGTAGYGYAGALKIIIQNNQLVFMINAKLSEGVGFGGYFCCTLNPEALADLISTLLSIQYQPGFKYYGFFDESDNGLTYQALNIIFHVVVTFGLTLAQAVLLPWSLLKEMSQAAMAKENSGYVGNFIMDSDYYESNQKWVTSTDVVMTKLLRVLIHYHSIGNTKNIETSEAGDNQQSQSDYLASNQGDYLSSSGATSQKPKLTAKDRLALSNQNQRQAILRILEWNGANKPKPSETDFNRFEAAIKRLEVVNPNFLWAQYPGNLFKLIRFFEAPLHPYESYSLSNDKTGNIYLKNAKDDLAKIKTYIKTMTRRKPIYYKTLTQTAATREANNVHYWVQQNPDSTPLPGYQLIDWTR